MSQIEDKSINQSRKRNEDILFSQSTHSIFAEDESNIKKLKALFDSVDVLLWSVKEYPNGELYYEKVNDIFAAVTGRRPSDYDGKPVIELGTEEDFQQIKHSLSVARKQGIYTYERRVGKPPEMRAFVIRIFPLPSEDGSCTYIGSGTDITDRVKAEEALKEEKERAQKYLDVAGVIMLVIDKEQKVSLINRKGCEILGYKEEDVIGKNWFDNFLPKRIREETKASFSKVGEGQQPVDYHENPVLTNLGVEKIILWHNVVLKDEAGNFIGLLGSGEDVTESKKTEKDLKRHMKSIEALYEISIDMSRATDLGDLISRTARLLNNNPDVLAGAIYLFEKDSFNVMLGKSFGALQSIYDDPAAVNSRDSFFKSILNNNEIFVDTIFSQEITDKEIGQRISAALRFNDSKLGFFSLVLKEIDYHTKNFFKLVASELERSISRKKSELELISTKQLLEKIAYTSPTFISVYDTKNQKMIFSNYSLLESLGYPAEEVTRISGLPDYGDKLNMYHPDDIKSLEEFDKKYSTLKDGEILEVQHRIKDFGGKWQWFRHLVGVFSRDENGLPVQSVNIFENITEKKKAEQELISTKQLLEKITYTSPTFISVFDIIEEKILFRNYSVLESLGYGSGEAEKISNLLHANRLFMYHPDDIKAINDHDAKLLTLKDREVIEVQYRIKDNKGEWQWFRHLSAVFLRDQDGYPIQSVNIFENITERKKAEQELISTKQLLEKITFTSPTFISVLEIESGKILFYNYSILESLGYTKEETDYLGSLIYEKREYMYHPDDLIRIRSFTDRFEKLKDREVNEVEYRIRAKNGHWNWFRHLAVVFQRNEAGHPVQTVNIFENITQRKNNEQELIATKQLLEKITESSPAIISVHDTESDNNIYQNRSMLSVLGYSEDEIIRITESQEGMYQLIHSEDRSVYDRFKGKIPSMKDGKSYPLEFRIKDHQGNWQWIRRLSSIFQRNDKGTPIQIVNIFENITDYKLAEEKLSRRNDQIIKQQAALLELSKMKNYELDEAFKHISEITSHASNAERVSIWLFNEEQQFLVCKDYYNVPFNIHESGFKLSTVDFSKLFQTVMRDVNSSYDEADFDIQSKEFIEKIIIPFGTASILTAPIRLHGDEIGYIIYEIKENLKSEWSVEEYDFVLSVSGFISMVLETAERIKAEKEIANSLKEKELLLREIHHRVKNNLQVISSLLYLQSKKIKDKQTLEVFIESQNRVKTMVLVHEKLYQSKDFIKINHSEYIRSLINSVYQSYMTNSEAVKLDLKVQNLYLNLDTTIHCGLIINELVSNSLKYAFPGERKGTIGVEFFQDNKDVYHLIVSDDGIGFPDGINFRETESLGLQLVLTLVEQLEGNIELDTSCGTAFKITFSSKKI